MPKPCTIITTEPKLWPPSLESPVSLAIQLIQKAKGFPAPNWKASHVRVYFDDDHVFDCTYPAVKWSRWQDVSKEKWRTWDPVFRCPDSFIASAYDAACAFVGRKYDPGQLFTMAAVDLLGYDETKRVAWFDSPGGRTVCSCAARSLFEKARHDAEAVGAAPPFEIMFATPAGKKIHVENTHPASFGSTPGIVHFGEPTRQLFVPIDSWR